MDRVEKKKGQFLLACSGTCYELLLRSFVRPFVHSFFRPFVHSFLRPFVHLSVTFVDLASLILPECLTGLIDHCPYPPAHE